MLRHPVVLAISLPLLLALGLPPVVANGTNRLPVLVGMATALWTLHRGRAIPWLFTLRLLPVFLTAAFAGAGLAALLPMDQIRLLVHVVRGSGVSGVVIEPATMAQ